ncbi:MAG: ATP-binding cassette domain-containing protein, partial [Alphaproteobacteria bacterium]|nr:ATP-binding cassette domain-containing protein [Alphaproteobacteria bacterium]
MLVVKEISSGYQGAQVLHNVSFDVQAGEIVCLFGRNGAGKST